jgi:hypothetical protein
MFVMVMPALTVAVAVAVAVAVMIPLAIAIPVTLALFPTLPLHFTFALMFLIVALILGFVFLRSHEVHRPIAGVVLTTVPAPIFCVIRRDVQIDGRRRSVLRLDHHGLCVDDRRPRVRADIDLTIHAGDDLPGQHDANVHSACIT